METVTINGTKYQLDVKKAIQDGYLKESNNLPKTWEEFCEKVHGQATSWIEGRDSAQSESHHSGFVNEFICEDTAQACVAFLKLLQLRDYYRQGWVPDWNVDKTKFAIAPFGNNRVQVEHYNSISRVLSFQSAEICDQFYSNFKDLIEQAKSLI